MFRTVLNFAAAFSPLLFASAACAQYRPPPPAPRLAPLTSSNTRNIYAPWAGSNLGSNHSLPPPAIRPAPLRAVPLPPAALPGGSLNPPPPPSLFSAPYGPTFTRPPGTPIIPFGSSRYYYHR